MPAIDYEKLGYVDGVHLMMVNIDQKGLTVSTSHKITMRPKHQHIFSGDEFLWFGSRCMKTHLFIPDTEKQFFAPLGWMPRMHAYAREENLEQCKQWLKEQYLNALNDTKNQLQGKLDAVNAVIAAVPKY